MLVLLLASLTLTACGSDATTATPVVPTTAPAQASPTTAPAATTGNAATTAAATTAASAATTAASVATTVAATTTSAAAPRGQTLTIAVAAYPASLDPTKNTPTEEPYMTLAYDSLLQFDADGNYQPLMATAWKWIGNDFKTLELQLRPNVKFSDGSTFDAAAVKAWFDVQKKTNGSGSTGLDSAEATGPLTVQIHLVQGNPLLPSFLTRNWITGDIACPAAAANPALVSTATCGTGPYMLDAKSTVTADTYTYVPNPNYWNPNAIHWNKIVLKVVANPQAALDALKAGQVQLIAPADTAVIDAGQTAGMKLAGVELNVQGLDFLDREGKIVPALKDARVRQALNYAIDKDALSKVLGGGKGRPVSTQFLPGSDGYDATLDSYYNYDVAKAKQLLTDAGFANGFELTILSAPFLGFDTLSQAVASYWQAIGVKTTIDSKPSVAEFLTGLSSGKYGVAVAGLGATTPTLITYNCCFKPGSAWNPSKTPVPDLQAIIEKLAATDATQAGPVAKQVNKYITEQAWFVPVLATKLYFLYSPKISGVTPTATEASPNILNIVPAQ
ncbi:MAG: peptide ABC transporter substrate-binding protein [Chloroflexi bacterium]|nr:peptide ABC transporter substrate-binding protein [Chloroflexota bacterium]